MMYSTNLTSILKQTSLILLIGLSLISSVSAEEKEVLKPSLETKTSLETEAVTNKTTSYDPSIPLTRLKLQLRPLNKKEITKELGAWMKLLREEISQSSKLAIQAQSYQKPSDIPEELEASQVKSRANEYALTRRIAVILDALKSKGGDVEEAQQYMDAVTSARSETEEKSVFAIMGEDTKKWLRDPDGGGKILSDLGIALFWLLSFWITAKILSKIIKIIISKRVGMSVMLGQFIERSAKGIVILMGLLFALSSLGIQVGPMIAAMSAGGFILGFALQDTLGNFASGMMVMFYRPFDIGHFVEVAGTGGRVDQMSLVSTTLLTPDNKELIIPNKKVWGDTIINYNSKRVRRVDLVFGIGYGDDIKKAAAILKDITESHEQVLKSPETVIQVGELADSSVNLLCRPWVRTKDYWAVYRELTWLVKERFDQEGISIPFPQRDLHVYQVEQAPSE